LTQFLDEIEAAVPALRRYARALTRDTDRADDLVQDCLERAIRKRSLWRPTGPLQAWLFRMLLNIHRNNARTLRRRREALGPHLIAKGGFKAGGGHQEDLEFGVGVHPAYISGRRAIIDQFLLMCRGVEPRMWHLLLPNPLRPLAPPRRVRAPGQLLVDALGD
jgi:hypothetical protein